MENSNEVQNNTNIGNQVLADVMGSGFHGSRFNYAGSKDGIQITLGCITPEARDLLDTIMEQWETHYANMKETKPKYEPSFYGFAYWLVRWSGLVCPSHCP
ncbi:MAG: hypothetical protein RLZZ605_1401 [Bacteroidota bacterium]|jgi:hypothetical protein